MTKQELIDSAATLGPFTPQAAQEYSEKQEQLATELNRIMEARSDLDKLIGSGNLEMMKQNHRNHALFVSSLLMSYDPRVLVETVLWVFRAYLAHGFHHTYWAAQLDTWLDVLPKHLSSQGFEQVAPLYRWLLVHIPQFATLSAIDLLAEKEPDHA